MLHAGTFQNMDAEMCRGFGSAARAMGERKIQALPGSCGWATARVSTEVRGGGRELEATNYHRK